MFSTTAEYALRALAHLAGEPADRSVLGRELARSADIPAQYLAKVLLVLKHAGVVETARGSGGGYRLARSAASVRLYDVVGLFDSLRIASSCFFDARRPCSRSRSCTAHRRWQRVCRGYLEFLEQTTLADVASHFEPTAHGWRSTPS